MLKSISQTYDGVVIVPMTVFNRQYYEEIIQKLIDDGINIKHYILYAEKNTFKRLNKRLERDNTWAKSHIDDCIEIFNTEITEEKIITDDKNIDDVVETVVERSGNALLV